MQKFVLRLFIFSILVSSFLFFLSFLRPENQTPSDYISAIIDKHTNLKRVKGHKIIFAGGSNLAFGINSKSIEDSLKVPVINLGLYGSLGMNFMINELKDCVQPGDIVFLSIEYFLSKDGDYQLKKYVSSIYPPSRNYFTQNLYLDFKNIFKTKQEEFKTFIDGYKEYPAYSRKAFDEYGDAIAHLDMPSSTVLAGKVVLGYGEWDGIELLNDFGKFCFKKNIPVYFLYPNFPKTEYKINFQAINSLKKQIDNDLKIPVLNNPEDFVLADSCFYDTIYHLNKNGRKLRTERLIALLKPLNLDKDVAKSN